MLLTLNFYLIIYFWSARKSASAISEGLFVSFSTCCSDCLQTEKYKIH